MVSQLDVDGLETLYKYNLIDRLKRLHILKERRWRIVLYEYQPNRKELRPREFLKDFKGFLHTDDCNVYHKLPEGITVVGYRAHIRRKLDKTLKDLPEWRRSLRG